MEWLDFEMVKQVAGTAFAQQFAIWTSSLGLAAWIHSGRVKKEIAAQVTAMTTALNNLASALTKGLEDHAERIEKVEFGVNELKGRFQELEN